MAGKLFPKPEPAKIEKQMLQEMIFTCQTITNSIAIKKTLLIRKDIESLNSGLLKELDGMLTFDLDLTVKYLDKSVRERLRDMQRKEIFKKANINITRDPSIPKLLVEISSSLTDLLARAMAFKHLCGGHLIIFVQKKKDKTLLS